ASNYHITYSNGTLTINTRALTITASPQSKTYGNVLNLGSSAFSTNHNEANTEQVTAVLLTSSSGADASTTAPAGTYPNDIGPSDATGTNGFLASNYNISYVSGNLTINQKQLSV